MCRHLPLSDVWIYADEDGLLLKQTTIYNANGSWHKYSGNDFYHNVKLEIPNKTAFEAETIKDFSTDGKKPSKDIQ